MGEGGPTSGSIGLIGRDGEHEAIAAFLDGYPLVTLVGPGGVGKTTLANDVATRSAGEFDGGVFIAELAGTSDDEDVAALVARQVDANSLEGLRLRSVGRPTLVVLDNCESALVASRTIAMELTAGESDIRVLATSRSPLYALGERLVPVRPLSVSIVHADPEDPGTLSPADLLFLTRADEAGAAWEHTPDNLLAVRQLTRQLNGLPLAIELAAARSRVLGPVELVHLLDQQLDLLVRPGGAKERHHSLRSVIETSYEPLNDTLKQFLRSLSFIAAPFDLRIAHAVAGGPTSELESLDLISQLVDASLLDTRQTSSGRTEYLLLDSIRAFGHEQLTATDEWAEVGERYAAAITALATDIVMAALQAFSPEVMAAIRDNFSHLVNAVAWCLEHDPSPARSYQMFLLFFGPTGASAEIAELARRVRETWVEPAPLQAEAYAVMGSLTFRTGRYEDGAELAAMAASHPDATDMAKLMGHRTLGYAAAVRRDPVAAIQHIDDALPFGIAFSTSFDREIRISRTAMVWEASGSVEALESLQQVLAEATEASEWVMVVWSQAMMAHHHRLLGDMAAALDSAQQALDVAEESKMAWATITAHHNMAALLALDQGMAPAAPHFRAALDAAVAIGDLDGSAAVLRAAAGAARRNGNDNLAKQLWATVPAHPGIPVPPSVFDDEEDELRELHGPPSRQDSRKLVRSARLLLDPAQPSAGTAAVAGTHVDTDSDTEPTEKLSIVFGEYELDPAMCELRRDGVRVAMEPQVYDVLVYLIKRRGEVVTKHELLDEVWGDRFVSEGALSSRISAARRVTGDNGKEQRIIRTVHGKGFAFVAEVEI